MPQGILLQRCNIYGGETGGIEKGKALGGLSSQKPDRQWYCERLAYGTYRMMCEHGHQGQAMPLCKQHVQQLITSPVTFCPRCNSTPPGHKCELKVVERS